MMDKKYIEIIDNHPQQIDFLSFLSQFKNKDEVNDFDMEDFLNIEFEKIGELKEKVGDLIQKASNVIKKDDNNDNKENMVVFFCEKLNQLKKNEINVQMFVTNIQKVDKVIKTENSTQVYFNTSQQ
jgi:hypothetical protein